MERNIKVRNNKNEVRTLNKSQQLQLQMNLAWKNINQGVYKF